MLEPKGGTGYQSNNIVWSDFYVHKSWIVCVPKTVGTAGTYQVWRYKNIATSWTHAIIAGTWTLSCFFSDPKLAEDLIARWSPSSHLLVCFSIGYFIHDGLDMLINRRKRETWELLGHHVIIVICFGIAIVTRLYVGYGVVSLLVEVNSVFLHLRQMLQIAKVDPKSMLYRCNSLVNLGTFVVFRIVLLAWMTRWLVVNRDRIPLPFYTIGSISMAVMVVMNIVLFYRVHQRDFRRRRKTSTS
ncbi:PREDICTED: TLC domain-containing protein 2-like [Priapulus caudatus]|uniref:TLC domain-containing protein 2-like n=1 Tax=Priapulus caudatus TaxID=37621 RepID=A0ABM1EF22_PRICU|nr:PREDICTED: TLC domain-containing protein 2-like [Priapulus caudatus]